MYQSLVYMSILCRLPSPISWALAQPNDGMYKAQVGSCTGDLVQLQPGQCLESFSMDNWHVLLADGPDLGYASMAWWLWDLIGNLAALLKEYWCLSIRWLLIVCHTSIIAIRFISSILNTLYFYIVITETKRLSWWRLCCHRLHWRLPWWQPMVLSETTS